MYAKIVRNFFRDNKSKWTLFPRHKLADKKHQKKKGGENGFYIENESFIL